MELLNFIVIDDTLKSKKIGNGRYSHAVNGMVFIVPGISVPVIEKGSGCVGLGMVEEIRITEASTVITFVCKKVSNDASKAYYDLYRNNASASTSNDVYDQSDVIIPGMMVQAKAPKPPMRRSSGNKSITDYVNDMDDDFHWD